MSKSTIKQLGDIKSGEKADVFAVIKSIEEKTASNNNPFIEFNLCDSTGECKAKMWNKKIENLPRMEAGTVVKARGQKDNYQQLIIEQIRLSKDGDDYNRELLKPGIQATSPLPTKKITDFILDEKVGMFALLKLINEKETKTAKPKPYLNMEFQDCTGNIDAKWWDKKNSEVLEMGIQQGVLVYVTGSMSEWSDKNLEIKNRQFTVTSMRLVTPEDGVKDDDFISIAPILGEVMYQQIMDFVETFKNQELKLLVKTIYEKYKKEITVFPASQLIHHDTKAGILYHNYQMLRCGLALGHIYFDEPDNFLSESQNKELSEEPNPSEEISNNGNPSTEAPEAKEEPKELIFSSELLATGILLHDIGKIFELDSNDWAVVKDYTKEGKLLGHMILGNDIVTEVAKELAISEEITILVKHMIVSHHFEETWGAYIKPQTAEAEMLHHLDLMDTKIYQFKKVLASVQKGFFSEKQVYLNSRTLYRSNF